MEEVKEVIGIDKVDMSGNLIFFEEKHNSNANFLLHTIVSHCKKKNHSICLVLFHNTFSHFCNSGIKLGLNLKKLQEESLLHVVEPFDAIFTKMFSKTGWTELSTSSNTELNEILGIVKIIKESLAKVNKESKNQTLFLIIDDISHLFSMGFDLKNVWMFLKYIKSFVNTKPNITICILSHTYKTDSEKCYANTLALYLRYSAQLTVFTQPLDSGVSENASGKMTVVWKSDKERLRFKWSEEAIYLYKLFDRQVKVFKPGGCLL